MPSHHEIPTASAVYIYIGPDAKSVTVEVDGYTLHVSHIAGKFVTKQQGCQSRYDTCDFPDCPCDEPHGFAKT